MLYKNVRVLNILYLRHITTRKECSYKIALYKYLFSLSVTCQIIRSHNFRCW